MRGRDYHKLMPRILDLADICRTIREGTMLIEGTFDSRTLANMEVALDRVCETVAEGNSHAVRKRIAEHIIRCARDGRTTLGELTAAGERALPVRNNKAAS
ncbi:hypothetical protein [Bradyrhizobium sp.]|uniref:hypothetical protein n=1 Tax=Bradyrhizobium sp. TaxID=376 RepID=UPI003C7B6E95